MKMSVRISFLIFLLSCSSVAAAFGGSSSTTHPSDVAALSALKSSILPGSIPSGSCLSSWNFSSDPCTPKNNPTHFICGLTCTATPSNSHLRVVSISLDPASYSSPNLPSSLFLNLTHLSHLDLASNSFAGPIPAHLPPFLTTLRLASNSFTGPIPGLLPRRLQTLDLSRNSLSGPIPASLPPSLTSLDLSSNLLSGQLPPSLPQTLVLLSARANSLSGPLTPLKPLLRLEVAELAANALSGEVPDWFFRLPSLQQVDLANNSFTRVTMSMRQSQSQTSLVAVDLSYNSIEGELPAGLAKVAALSARGNRLRGRIPEEYGSSGRLRRVFLDGNYLSGEVPQGLLNLTAGSLGDNCFRHCPASTPICQHAPQKPDWVCTRVYGRRPATTTTTH